MFNFIVQICTFFLVLHNIHFKEVYQPNIELNYYIRVQTSSDFFAVIVINSCHYNLFFLRKKQNDIKTLARDGG